MDTNTETTGTTAPASKPAKAKKAPTKRPAKKAAAKKSAPVGKQIAKATDGTPLKTLCAKLGMETKLARRKLRAAKFDWHGHRERWNFNAKQLEKAKEILSA